MLQLHALLWVDLVTNAYWALGLGYVVLFLAFAYFWFGKKEAVGMLESLPQVSLVIAIRNEQTNLAALFAHLRQLNYPALEVLLVDDQSEDESLALMQQAAVQAQAVGGHWRVLQSVGSGKKAAISTALAVAKGELIVTTDADCGFSPEWIDLLVAPFSDQNIQLVAGPVMTTAHPNYFFSAFQQVEWTSILLVTRLSFSTGIPFMCSAANMTYRKSAFEQVNGYAGNGQFLSGDDEFLLKKILHTYGKTAVKYLHQPQLLVTTQPQSNWTSFLAQRARWASKWRRHDLGHLIIAALPALLLLLFLVSPLLLLLGKPGLQVFLGLWALKISIEYLVVASVLKRFNVPLSLLAMAATSCSHPFYALATALTMGNKNWKWKGRSQSS